MPTAPKVHAIEVFEWQTGAPRPGTVGKARHDCLDILEAPPEGQAPQVGDVIALPDPTGRELLHYAWSGANSVGFARAVRAARFPPVTGR